MGILLFANQDSLSSAALDFRNMLQLLFKSSLLLQFNALVMFFVDTSPIPWRGPKARPVSKIALF
jgi:hypothetical protein